MIAELTLAAEWSQTVRISKSAITEYLICPKKFQYHYVLAAAPEFRPLTMVFGSAMHEVIGSFYRHLLVGNPRPDLQWLLDDWRIVWKLASKDPLIQWEHHTPESMGAMGEALLAVFNDNVHPRKVEGVEYPFSVDLIDPDTGQALDTKLVGFIDLIESDEDGELILSELKTASKKMGDAQSESQLDGLVYAYAMDQLGHHQIMAADRRETLVRYDVLVKTKTPSFQQVFVSKEPGDYRRLVRTIKAILGSIESAAFHPVEGWACKGCQFRTACREGMAS